MTAEGVGGERSQGVAGLRAVPDPPLDWLATDAGPELRQAAGAVQAAQRAVVTREPDRVLVVQGGWGTGRTMVAMQRVSWLLEQSSNPGDMLIVGPHPTYMRYVSTLLPGAGERGPVRLPVTALGPRARVTRIDPPALRRLKGDRRMLRVIVGALRNRQRVDGGPIELRIDGRLVRVDGSRIAARARQLGARPHNEAYRDLRSFLVDELRSLMARGPRGFEANGRNDLVRAVDAYLEQVWPMLTPQALLVELLSTPRLLAAAAAGLLNDDEIELLTIPEDVRVGAWQWSADDVPLLDAADVLLNGQPATYGHIVVDEAQDLSPMQLESVRRRSRAGSMTLLGDLAQGTGPWAHPSWEEVALHVRRDRVPTEIVELDLDYRLPAEVHDVATRLLGVVAPDHPAPRPVRPAGAGVLVVPASGDLASTVVGTVDKLLGSGLVGVVVAARQRARVAAALERAGLSWTPELRGDPAPIVLLSPAAAKGLEVDAVVVVEPEQIVSESEHGLRSLLVAITRGTHRLALVHEQRLPAELGPVEQGPRRRPDGDRDPGVPAFGQGSLGEPTEGLPGRSQHRDPLAAPAADDGPPGRSRSPYPDRVGAPTGAGGSSGPSGPSGRRPHHQSPETVSRRRPAADVEAAPARGSEPATAGADRAPEVPAPSHRGDEATRAPGPGSGAGAAMPDRTETLPGRGREIAEALPGPAPELADTLPGPPPDIAGALPGPGPEIAAPGADAAETRRAPAPGPDATETRRSPVPGPRAAASAGRPVPPPAPPPPPPPPAAEPAARPVGRGAGAGEHAPRRHEPAAFTPVASSPVASPGPAPQPDPYGSPVAPPPAPPSARGYEPIEPGAGAGAEAGAGREDGGRPPGGRHDPAGPAARQAETNSPGPDWPDDEVVASDTEWGEPVWSDTAPAEPPPPAADWRKSIPREFVARTSPVRRQAPEPADPGSAPPTSMADGGSPSFVPSPVPAPPGPGRDEPDDPGRPPGRFGRDQASRANGINGTSHALDPPEAEPPHAEPPDGEPPHAEPASGEAGAGHGGPQGGDAEAPGADDTGPWNELDREIARALATTLAGKLTRYVNGPILPLVADELARLVGLPPGEGTDPSPEHRPRHMGEGGSQGR